MNRKVILVACSLFLGFTALAAGSNDVVISSPSLVPQFDRTVLNGFTVDTDSELAHQTVFLAFFDKASHEIGECTGFIMSDDTIGTAGHCFLPSTDLVAIFFNDHVLRDDYTKYSPQVRKSYHFISFYKRPETQQEDSAERKFFAQNYLPSDERGWQMFNSYFNSLRTWDYADMNSHDGVYSDMNQDFGFIYFTGGLPPGAKPVTFAGTLDLPFKSKVTIAGFGSTKRKDFANSNSNYSLHMTQVQLFRVIKSETGSFKGYGFYNAGGMSVCYGDSGSPMFVFQNKTLYFLGMTIDSFNGCQNDGAGILLEQFMPRVQKFVQFFREAYGPGHSELL